MRFCEFACVRACVSDILHSFMYDSVIACPHSSVVETNANGRMESKGCYLLNPFSSINCKHAKIMPWECDITFG